MNGVNICILVESKKFFRSKVPLLTFIGFLFVPFMGGFFMFILKDPDLARRLGFISAKAHLMGTADWPSYLFLLAQAVAIGGIFVFGFATAWIFGREYSDRTINDLLALPVSRGAIVMAKFIVVLAWSFALSLLVLGLGLLVGGLVGIPEFSLQLLGRGIGIYLLCSTLTVLLSTPVGLAASVGRGYLPPLGLMIATVILSQIIAVTGRGHLFPWSIPAVFSQAVTGGNALIETSGIIIVVATSLVGLFGTIYWWSHADQD